MNRICLFGKVIFKSKLKYIIFPKLKIYREIVVETVSGDKFYCIFDEDKCELINNIKLEDYIFVQGFGVMDGERLKIYTNKIYF